MTTRDASAAVEVHHEEEGPGDAPPLVLSGSVGTNLSMWDPQMPALSGSWRVVRYDHRGHGKSPVPPGPYTIDDLGADTLALLDRLGLARVSFCGLSLGGMVGMWLAANAPERIDRLVLCCTSAWMPPPEGWMRRAATAREHGTGAMAEGQLERWFTPAFRDREPGRTREFAEMLAATPDEGYAGCCELLGRMDLRARLSAVRAPTLIVAAADDSATPPDDARAIAEGIRAGGGEARVEVVSGAAHLANVERADVVTPLITDHLMGASRT